MLIPLTRWKSKTLRGWYNINSSLTEKIPRIYMIHFREIKQAAAPSLSCVGKQIIECECVVEQCLTGRKSLRCRRHCDYCNTSSTWTTVCPDKDSLVAKRSSQAGARWKSGAALFLLPWVAQLPAQSPGATLCFVRHWAAVNDPHARSCPLSLPALLLVLPLSCTSRSHLFLPSQPLRASPSWMVSLLPSLEPEQG